MKASFKVDIDSAKFAQMSADPMGRQMLMAALYGVMMDIAGEFADNHPTVADMRESLGNAGVQVVGIKVQ